MLDKSGSGVEIGPSFSPIAPKAQGFKVKTLDHATADELREKYRAHGVNVAAIEDVDFVWRGERFAELVGKEKFDWIIASHVIEHTPCLITFLQDCESVLPREGVLALAVPDKRFCFDVLRQKSGLGKVIDTFRSGDTIHTVGTAAEYYLNVAALSGRIGWAHGDQGSYSFVHSLDDAKAAMARIDERKEFIDLHNWVFTPHSFRLLIHDLGLLSYTSLRETTFWATEGLEFFIALSKVGTGPDLTRIELAIRAMEEH